LLRLEGADGGPEWRLARVGRRVVVREVVDQFLDPDRIRRWQVPARERRPQDGIGSGVYINREGGYRGLACDLQRGGPVVRPLTKQPDRHHRR